MAHLCGRAIDMLVVLQSSVVINHHQSSSSCLPRLRLASCREPLAASRLQRATCGEPGAAGATIANCKRADILSVKRRLFFTKCAALPEDRPVETTEFGNSCYLMCRSAPYTLFTRVTRIAGLVAARTNQMSGKTGITHLFRSKVKSLRNELGPIFWSTKNWFKASLSQNARFTNWSVEFCGPPVLCLTRQEFAD